MLGLAGLALLAVPRVVLHDADIIQEGDLPTLLLVFVPFGIWVWHAATRALRPFLTMVVIGVFHGAFLGATHLATWTLLGIEKTVADRIATVPISLAVGVAWGLILGGVTVLVTRTMRSRAGVRPRRRGPVASDRRGRRAGRGLVTRSW